MDQNFSDDSEIKKLLHFVPNYFDLCAQGKIIDIRAELEKHASQNLSIGHARGIINACQSGHLELAQYLESISSPEAFSPEKINDMVLTGCYNGHYDIVKHYSDHPQHVFTVKHPEKLAEYAVKGLSPQVLHYVVNKYDLKQYLQPYLILRLAVSERHAQSDIVAASDNMISVLAAQYDVRKPTKKDIALLDKDEIKPEKAAFKRINEIYQVIEFKKKLEKDLPIQGVQTKRPKV